MAQEINKQFKTMSGVTKLLNFVERDSYMHCSWNNKDKVIMLFWLPVHLFQNSTHFIRLILIISSPLYSNLEGHVMCRLMLPPTRILTYSLSLHSAWVKKHRRRNNSCQNESRRVSWTAIFSLARCAGRSRWVILPSLHSSASAYPSAPTSNSAPTLLFELVVSVCTDALVTLAAGELTTSRSIRSALICLVKSPRWNYYCFGVRTKIFTHRMYPHSAIHGYPLRIP